MASPATIEARIKAQWEREEITLNELVPLLQRCGWTKAQVYDWLCGEKPKRPAYTRMYHTGAHDRRDRNAH